MPQIFSRRTNLFARASVFGAAFMGAGMLAFLGLLFRSSYETGVGQPVSQPIDFSHAHHVGEEAIDCRFCHASVETAAFAGMPSSAVCMICHRHVRANSPWLAPLRESVETGRPIAWQRVNDLSDFTYFHHGVHTQNGIACETCHGRVDQMKVVYKTESLQMEWCLECHRQPERYVRPRDAVFAMGYEPAEPQGSLGPRLKHEYDIEAEISCSTCHR